MQEDRMVAVLLQARAAEMIQQLPVEAADHKKEHRQVRAVFVRDDDHGDGDGNDHGNDGDDVFQINHQK